MLEGKYYYCDYIVSKFTAGYIYKVTKYENEPRSRENNTLYSELVSDLWSVKRLSGVHDEQVAWLRIMVREFKTKIVVLFKDHLEPRLFIMKSHLLEPLCKESAKFQNISLLDAAPYDLFNVFSKSANRKSSVRRAIKMKDSVKAVEPALKLLKGIKGLYKFVPSPQQEWVDSKPWMWLVPLLQGMDSTRGWKVLTMAAVRADYFKTHDNLIIILRRNKRLEAVHILVDLVNELCRERDVLIGGLGNSTKLVSSRRIFGLEEPTLPDLIYEVNRVGQWT